MSPLPTRADVLTAAERITGRVERTPLRSLRVRDATVWLKCESMQTGGAFKLRGASNRLLKMNDAERARGVVAFSSGNHAQGVAIAARRLGMDATIVMPADAPRLKIAATEAAGATIRFYDRATEDRVAMARALAEERGATLVPSFDDPDIVAGQGTVGLEILQQLGRAPRQIVVPTGGGGLAAGIALACPDTQIVCVEPEGWDDLARSLEAGEILPVGEHPPATLCDAIQTPRVSPITFGILREANAKAVAVSEAETANAIRLAFSACGLIVEPGGAVALAAVLSGKVEILDVTVVVLSGGNIDPALHAAILGEADQPTVVR